jgi:hypothetical protein
LPNVAVSIHATCSGSTDLKSKLGGWLPFLRTSDVFLIPSRKMKEHCEPSQLPFYSLHNNKSKFIQQNLCSGEIISKGANKILIPSYARSDVKTSVFRLEACRATVITAVTGHEAIFHKIVMGSSFRSCVQTEACWIVYNIHWCQYCN